MSSRTLPVSAGSLATLALSFAGFICLGLPDGTLGVAWPSIRNVFNRDQADFGSILLAHGIAYFLSGLVAAKLSRQLTPAILLCGGSIASVTGMLTIANAPVWPVILAGASIIGVGSGILNTTINTYASQNFSARNVNWLHACYSLGASLGPVVTGVVLSKHWTWNWGYMLVAIVPAVMAITYIASAKQWATTSIESNVSSGARSGGLDPLLVRQACLFFCYSGLELTLGRWCYTVLTELRGLTVESAAFASSAFFSGVFAGRLLLGAIVNQVGPTRMVRSGAGIAVIGALVFAFTDGIFAATGLVLMGFAMGPIFPTLVAQASGRFPRADLARAIAISVAAAILGSTVAPYVAGWIAQSIGLIAVPIQAVILASLLVLLHEAVVSHTSTRPVTKI